MKENAVTPPACERKDPPEGKKRKNQFLRSVGRGGKFTLVRKGFFEIKGGRERR